MDWEGERGSERGGPLPVYCDLHFRSTQCLRLGTAEELAIRLRPAAALLVAPKAVELRILAAGRPGARELTAPQEEYAQEEDRIGDVGGGHEETGP
jgi:hypothetical protein